MHRLFALPLLALSLPAQDFLHYKFDAGCGTEVVNYADGPSAGGNGTLASASPVSPWVPGVFANAMAGWSTAAAAYNRVQTGWDPSLTPWTGDLTMACFLKQRGTSVNYLWGNTGGFRCFTGGIGARGLYQRTILASGGNGINASIANDFYLPATAADFQTLAATNWCHIAIVVDAAAQTADWYVNGVSVVHLTGIVGGALINAAGEFTVGSWGGSNSAYDCDEFILSHRAFTAAEILAMQTAPRGGGGRFTSGVTQCGTSTLTGINGPPVLGNFLHALQIQTSIANSFWSILFGGTPCTLGGSTPLPLNAALLSPLAAGCQLLVDTNMGSFGGVGAGNVTVQMPIVPVPAYIGINLYAQAALLDLSPPLSVQATNGWAISVGI